jgi:uncharacterized protein
MLLPKLAMITGGCSGLGFAFANELAANGSDLIIISRDIEKLKNTQLFLENKYNVKIYTIQSDLSKDNCIDALKHFFNKYSLYPDLLINNAGSGIYGVFNSNDENKLKDIINLNIKSLTMISNFIIRRMLQNGCGSILNISSTIAFRKSPYWSVYSASKSYILSLSRSLTMEYRDSPINISVLCPGKINTDFDINSNFTDTSNPKKASPEFIANYAIRKTYQGKKLIIPGLINKIKYYLFRFIPEFLTDFIISKL